MTDHTHPPEDEYDCPTCHGGGDMCPIAEDYWKCPTCDAEYQDHDTRIIAAKAVMP